MYIKIMNKHDYFDKSHNIKIIIWFSNKSLKRVYTLEIIEKITNNLVKNETLFNIYINLSKAFDTLNHTILLNKLKYHRVTGSGSKLIINIYSLTIYSNQRCVIFLILPQDYVPTIYEWRYKCKYKMLMIH